MRAKMSKSPLMQAVCGPKEHMAPGFDVTTLSRDDRVRSVGPLLINKAYAYWERLTPREKANYSVEDVILELWAEIASKDEYYDPLRGRYTTFAMNLAHKYLSELRNRMRTVHSPRNAEGRLKVMSADSKTGRDILRSMKDTCGLKDMVSENEHEAVDTHARSESIEKTVGDLIAGINSMGFSRPALARILSMKYGINMTALKPGQIAHRIGKDVSETMALIREAEAALAKILNSDGIFTTLE